jgi:predicted  nucleic acid-binding Zn-ribbon protein
MVDPEIIELREKYGSLQTKYESLSERMARAEGRLSDNSKQTIWQFAIFMIGMATLVFAILNYQTRVFDQRFEALERRIGRIEKSLDDLNKELRNRPK